MKKSIIAILAVVALVVVLGSAVYVVEENQYACTFRFSEIVETKAEAGLYFKIPFVDEVQYFPKTTMLYDIPPSEVLTSDKQNMTVDCYILWSIADPQQFYRAVGTTEKAEVRLDAITYTAMKIAMGSLAQADIINMNDGAERNDIYEGITTTVNSQAAAYGICVEDVKIKQFDLPESNLNAVHSRMISSSCSSRGLEPSQTKSTRSASSTAFLLRSTPIASTVSEVSRMPAVSMSRSFVLPSMTVSSTVSRVVPGISVTITRS